MPRYIVWSSRVLDVTAATGTLGCRERSCRLQWGNPADELSERVAQGSAHLALGCRRRPSGPYVRGVVCEVSVADASAWFALAGALGGVTLAGVLGLVTAGLNHKWGEQTRVEVYREQQLKEATDQRRRVCHDYLVAVNSYWLTCEQLYFKALRAEEFDRIEHMRSAITALQDTYAYLTISCGVEVRKQAHSYNNALYAVHNAAEEADQGKWDDLYPKTHRTRASLREAIRAELGVKD